MKKLIVALCLLSSACASSKMYNQKVSSWIGHDVNELTQVWGYPSSSFVAPNGNTVYAYQRTAQGKVPYYTTPNGFAYGNYTFGGQSTDWYCLTYFEVNSEKIIIQSRWEGNLCK